MGLDVGFGVDVFGRGWQNPSLAVSCLGKLRMRREWWYDTLMLDVFRDSAKCNKEAILKRILIAGLLSALLLAGCGGSKASLPETTASNAVEAVVYKSPT